MEPDKKTRVVVLPADTGACGYYRLRLPAGAVQKVRPDWSVEVYRPGDVKLGGDANHQLVQIYGIPDVRNVDLLVMQRTGTPLQVEFIRWANDNGIATVLDSDDAMWAIDKENSAHKAWNGSIAHWSNLDRAAELADLTTVTTSALARRYGKHGRVEVLPNCVPGDLRELLTSARPELDATVTIGWAGFTGTHPRDLEVVGDAVRRVVDETGCHVRVVGDAEGAALAWVVNVEPVSPQPLGLPYFTALTTIDVGLVPLRDSPFNNAKSYLKALEFAAVGVPVIASPTPANRELAKSVPMTLANSPSEWYGYLLRFITDPSVREQRSGYGQDVVFRQHTYEANAERWASAWERAMARRARMSA